MIGGIAYSGRWGDHVRNRLTLGLILEVPISKSLSVEAEGVYGKYHISYSSFGHYFNQFGLGGNAKFYFIRGKFNPYVAAGVMGLYYDNMIRSRFYPSSYSHWLGSGQLIVGGDVNVTKDIAVGIRGALVKPLFNRPVTIHNRVYSAPGFEESAAINSSFYKFMGAVKVAF